MGIRNKVSRLLAKAIVFEKSAILRLAGFKDSFVWALNDLLADNSVSVTINEVKPWFDKNQSVLGTALDHSWSMSSRQGEYYLYAYIRTNDKNEDIYAWITVSPKPPEEADVSQASVLQPDGKIPKFWFWVGKYVHNRGVSKLNLDLSHNHFLVDAITNLFYESLTDSTIEKISKFIEANKAKINRIRSQFGMSNPKYLGGGADGRAYAISPTLVLKLFRDQHSYKAAVEAVERLHKNPALAKTEAMIYDVGVLGEYDGSPLYYYIIEQMKTVRSLPSNVQEAVEKVVGKLVFYITDEKASKWRALKKLIADPKNHAKIKEEVTKGAKEMAENAHHDVPKHYFSAIENELEVRSTWLQSLAEELLMKYLTGRTDLHLGNIGLTGYGEFRYYDPAYGGHESDINAPMW